LSEWRCWDRRPVPDRERWNLSRKDEVKVSREGKECTVPIRVRYAESDQMGVAYYANYLIWFEMGRVELMRELAIPYSGWEKQGFFLPVSESYCKYMTPTYFDELLDVRCRVGEVRTRAVRFQYELLRGGQLVAEGHTVHVCTNRDARPITFPDSIRNALKGALVPEEPLGAEKPEEA